MRNITNYIFIAIIAFSVYWFYIRKQSAPAQEKEEEKDEPERLINHSYFKKRRFVPIGTNANVSAPAPPVTPSA